MGRKTAGPFWAAGLPNQTMKTNLTLTAKRLGSLICLLLLACNIFLTGLQAQCSEAGSKDDYDSLIVVPRKDFKSLRRANILFRKQGILRYQRVSENIYVLPLDASEDRQAKISELQNSDLFDLVEPDYKLSIDNEDRRKYVKVEAKEPVDINQTGKPGEITPNDVDFTSQYYLRQINATKAWSTTVGDELVVGILDTGVDEKHPDLIGKVISLSESDYDDTVDDIGHGTEVSGIIAANTNNNQGIAGISWKTKILPIKITDKFGQAKVSSVVRALDTAYKHDVKIVQISLSTSQFSQILKDAVKLAQDRNILIISTGGNTSVQELRYPAAFSGVIGVGAVNRNKEIESYSSTGEHVSLVAPGSNIYTTTLFSSYVSVSGTSFSAPQVTGAAALVWSVAPDLLWNEVREVLINSAEDLGDKGKDIVYGYGLLDIEKAVALAKAKQLEKQAETSDDYVIESWIGR